MFLEKFERQEVRIISADPLEVVAKDIVDILYPQAKESKSYSHYLDKVPEKYKGRKRIPTPGGEQEMVTLLEPGIYYLIARSNSPIAEPFQSWLFEEVLPSIRKTGGYNQFENKFNKVPEGRFEKLLADASAIAKFFESRGIKSGIATQFALAGVAKLCPDRAELLQLMGKEAGYEQSEENRPLTPTNIASILSEKLNQKISAIAVNKKLSELKLQTVQTNNKKAKEYCLTVQGKEFGEALLVVIQKGNFKKTKYDIRWQPEVIDILVINWM